MNFTLINNGKHSSGGRKSDTITYDELCGHFQCSKARIRTMMRKENFPKQSRIGRKNIWSRRAVAEWEIGKHPNLHMDNGLLFMPDANAGRKRDVMIQARNERLRERMEERARERNARREARKEKLAKLRAKAHAQEAFIQSLKKPDDYSSELPDVLVIQPPPPPKPRRRK